MFSGRAIAATATNARTSTLLLCLAISACLAAPLTGCVGEERRCVESTCPADYRCSADGDGCIPIGEPPAPTTVAPSWVSVAIRPDGLPFVAAHDTALDALAAGWVQTDQTIRYHYPDGAGDPAAGLPPAARDRGTFADIAIGGDGYPRVAYYDARAGALRFARFDGASWHVEQVDGPGAEKGSGADSDVGRYASLAIDEDDRAHIAYYDATRRTLRYAVSAGADGAGWNIVTVPLPAAGEPADGEESDRENPGPFPVLPSAPPDYGRFASIGLSLGSPVIAFYEAAGGDLYLARGDIDGWTVLLLDGRDQTTGVDQGDVGRHASLAVGRYGEVSVAYHDATRGTLRYVRGAAGVPTVEIVDDGTQDPAGGAWPDCAQHLVGQRAALAVDETGARVAYFDATALSLRFARRGADGAWNLSTLDADTGAGLWLDHAAADGTSWIAYTHLDLYRARPAELRLQGVTQ